MKEAIPPHPKKKKEEIDQGSIALPSAEATSDWLAQDVSHMRSRRQANLAILRSSETKFALKGTVQKLAMADIPRGCGGNSCFVLGQRAGTSGMHEYYFIPL